MLAAQRRAYLLEALRRDGRIVAKDVAASIVETALTHALAA